MLERHVALVGDHRAGLRLDRDLVEAYLQQLRVLEREGVLGLRLLELSRACSRKWLLLSRFFGYLDSATDDLIAQAPATLRAPCSAARSCRSAVSSRLAPPARAAATRSCRSPRCAPGMQCTGPLGDPGHRDLQFDVEVLDVIADDPAVGGPRILIRVSGPAVDATGIGPGLLRLADPLRRAQRRARSRGHRRVRQPRGARHADRGDPHRAAQPAPAGARRAPRLRRAARPLRPADRAGLSPGTRRLLARAAAARRPRGARRAARARSAATRAQDLGRAPRWPRRSRPATWRWAPSAPSPTATATQIYAFGHALDALGRRALFLQDAYVFGVIGNPLGVPDFGADHLQADLLGRPCARDVHQRHLRGVAGSSAPGPPAIPLRVTARERGGGGSVDARLAARRRARPRPRRRHVASSRRWPPPARSSGCSRLRAGDAEGLHALPGAPGCAGRSASATPTSTASPRSSTWPRRPALVDDFDFPPLEIEARP